MSRLKPPYGTTAALTAAVVQERDFAYDTTLDRFVMGDGILPAGKPLAFKSEIDTLPVTSNASNALVTATGSTTARTLANRFADVANVKDFGAVGDGVTNDGPAFAAANAAGATKYVPYSASGYNLGTTTLTVTNGQSWVGDGNVKLISSTTTRLFDITSNLAIGALIQGFTIDMTGAGASSMAVRFENTNPVSNAVVRDMQFQNCYRAIGCTGNASFIFECLIENIRCVLTKGLQIHLPFSRGFVQVKNVNIDNTLPANARVTWTSILIEKPAGVFLEDVDVTGQANEAGPWCIANAYVPVYDAGAIGIKIDGSGVNEGYVWTRRVRCESSMGPGIQLTDFVFLYGEDLETYACLGIGVYLEDIIEGSLTNVTGRGASGLTGVSASAHAIAIVDCQGLQITNAKGINSTGHGILFSGSNCLYNMITNAQCWDNTLYGIADASSAASNVVIGADFRNNGSGDKSISGTDSVVVLNRGGAALAFLNNPTSANLRALISDESGTGAALFANGALGTPASGLLTNATGLPISTGVSGLGTGVAAFLATPSSANLATAVTDETGTGALVLGTGPTLNQPNIVGTTTNNSAAAGSVGEMISSTVGIGAAVSLTDNTAANITSISLTAGDWDVEFASYLTAAATTSITRVIACISQTSATLSFTAGTLNDAFMTAIVPTASANPTFITPVLRISLASTTTIYAVGFARFTLSTLGMYGIIRARRVR